MEFLGVGPQELAFILLIALLVIGPKELAKTARTLGRTLNTIVKSDNYRLIQQASQELRKLPTQLMRDAHLEESLNEIKQTGNEMQSAFEVGSVDERIRAGWSADPAKDPVIASPAAPTLRPPEPSPAASSDVTSATPEPPPAA